MVEDHLEYKVEDLIQHRGKGTRRHSIWCSRKGIHLMKQHGNMSEDLVNAPEILEAYLHHNNLLCRIETVVSGSEVPV